MAIILKIDKPVYQQGDIIQVRGTASPIIEGQRILYTVKNADSDETIEDGTVFLNDLGHYNFRISARGEGWVNGTFRLTVTYGEQTVFEMFQYRNVIVDEDIEVWRTKVEGLEREIMELTSRNSIIESRLTISRAIRIEQQKEIERLKSIKLSTKK